MNPYIEKSCTACDEGGFIKIWGSTTPCTICGGSKELPNEEGKKILELVRRFNRFPHNIR